MSLSFLLFANMALFSMQNSNYHTERALSIQSIVCYKRAKWISRYAQGKHDSAREMAGCFKAPETGPGAHGLLGNGRGNFKTNEASRL